MGRLEQGELADLFRAEESQAPVVVKLFHPKTTDAAYAKVVADTARRLKAVSRPGIAHVLDVGLVKGRLAIVREDVGRYPLGLVLQRLHTREVHLPPVLALTITLELLALVGEANAAGVVHGALTPGNVHLADDGRVGVSEFGALAALQASAALKKAFASHGRNSYRAPEGVNGEPQVALDVYALGAIAYELLTLREAALGKSNVSTRSDRLPPPSRLVRRLNARVDPVIMRALESSPSRRYRSCADFAEALRDFLSGQGGVAGQAELQKFVRELFPNEVQVTQLGPVPFDAPFRLEDIAGVGTLDEGPAEATDRAPFSGGLVDDRAPTSDGLPVFTLDDLPTQAGEKTEPGGQPGVARKEEPQPPATWDASAAQQQEPKPPTSWVAPPAELPTLKDDTAPTQGDAVNQRVRVREDFAPGPTPAAPPTPRQAHKKQSVAKTIMTFVVPFKREGDPEIPDFEKLRLKGRRQARVVAFIATVILFSVVTGLAVGWYQSTPDPKSTLLSYLPDPIEREVAPDNRPPPPSLGKPLKLPDFDKQHPEKAFVPPPPDKPEVKAVKPKAPPPPAADCYAPPKGKNAVLTIAVSRPVRVEIDGQRVCGSLAKVPVEPGVRKVRVVDTRSKQEYVAATRFQAGKQVKLLPNFK
ncbi:MAG: protein kinase [Myxococcales bacterium]|nr:protein kinase [Myxococcales bacterium]